MITALLHHFYAFMVWSSELELAIARIGGNMALINKCTETVNKWEIEQQRFEWRMKWMN